MKNTRTIEKFWRGVEKTDTCWNWIGQLDKRKVPTIRLLTRVGPGKYRQEEYSPRRLSLELTGKTLTSEKVQLTCGNTLCVNPEHIVFGNEGRFWSYVQKLPDDINECWMWTSSMTPDMYGEFRLYKDGKRTYIRATAYSWELHTGKPVPPGFIICHHCDQPSCVNPHHLFIGTPLDNSRDMVAKGRQCKGEKNGSAKLTEADVKDIRRLHKAGKSIKHLANLYGLHISHIWKVTKGEVWKHVK